MTVTEAKFELKQLRREPNCNAIRKIESLSPPHRDILLNRYAKALSWRQIAGIMEYSTDHLRGYMNKKAIEKYAEAK